MERSQVAIIIPAFNEESTISRVVSQVKDWGHVIVVDDCSTDQTAQKAQSAGAIIVRHLLNKGYDQALNSGFAKADELACRFAITFDADGQHDAGLIKKFLELLQESADLVVGIRPYPARISEKIFADFTRKRFGLEDPLCGMKGYKLSLYREQGCFDSYGSIGTQLMLFALRKLHPFAQVPVRIAQRTGRPRFGHNFKANLRIFRAMIFAVSNFANK